jgi:hypothetical protein
MWCRYYGRPDSSAVKAMHAGISPFAVSRAMTLHSNNGQIQAHVPAMMWRVYHEATKHNVESLRRARHRLDWTNMPDPFRHYEGVPVLDLPVDLPVPEMLALDVLQGRTFGTMPVSDGPTFLSQLLFYSAAISASKGCPVDRR